MPQDVNNQILQSMLMKAINLLKASNPKVSAATAVLNDALEVLNCDDLGPVLMVERNAAILELVQEALQLDGIEIYGVEDVVKATELVEQMNKRKTPIRVVILALGADSSEILTFYHNLRISSPQVKVILTSGNLAEISILTAGEHDFWATLRKPYKMSALKTLILSALSNPKD